MKIRVGTRVKLPPHEYGEATGSVRELYFNSQEAVVEIDEQFRPGVAEDGTVTDGIVTVHVSRLSILQAKNWQYLEHLFNIQWHGVIRPTDEYEVEPGSGVYDLLTEDELNKANVLCEELYLNILPDMDDEPENVEKWKKITGHPNYPELFHVLSAFDDLGIPEPKQSK